MLSPSACRRPAAARSAACRAASRSAGCRGCRRASASTAGSRSSACRTPAAAASSTTCVDRIEPRARAAGEDDALRFIASGRRVLQRRSNSWYAPLVTAPSQRVVVQIPFDRAAHARCERLAPAPSGARCGCLRRVDRVRGGRAAADRWTNDESAAACSRSGPSEVERRADCAHDIEVLHLGAAADVVRVAGPTARKHGADRQRNDRRRRASRARSGRRRTPAAACRRSR